MITIRELKNISKAHLKDAEVLFQNRRYDGAIYLCGYAVELALKARICKTLRWNGFPESRKEFENYKSFRTHNLDVLFTLSGMDTKIKQIYLFEWSIVTKWNPEIRYSTSGITNRHDANDMIKSILNLIFLKRASLFKNCIYFSQFSLMPETVPLIPSLAIIILPFRFKDKQ